MYTASEIREFIVEEEVKFIKLEFCDIFGKPKCITIMPSEFSRAIEHGISIDGSAVVGLGGDNIHSDLFLVPDLATFSLLPWRPENGKAVSFFCYLRYPDGRDFENDSRRILKEAVEEAAEKGYSFSFGSEFEFYLFNGMDKTTIDDAGYMDTAPDDKGDNIRREVCLMLEELGLKPEGSHHEEGPGQNEIDFSYADPLSAADNAQTFCNVVKTVAERNGFIVDFSPKPLEDKAGNGLHINISAKGGEGDNLSYIIAGILHYAKEMTLFLNPSADSYRRLGSFKAPRYVSWSSQNRSQLVRVPAAKGEYVRAELRSPDATTNLYLAYALLIKAGLYGIENKLQLPEETNVNLFTADEAFLSSFDCLPSSLEKAKEESLKSAFIKSVLPSSIIELYMEKN